MRFFFQLRNALRWLVLSIFVGILAGTASALLIVLLNWATATREAHHWLIALLPVAGLAVGLLYYYLGQSVDAGNDLIVEQIHAEADAARSKIPFRMTPLILLATTLTHLFGGSVGREGTAVQTGASLADQIDRLLSRIPWLTLSRENRRTLLIAGISAGFASVFDTPLAGAVFGLEVLTIGTVRYDALFPCFLAAFAADYVTRAWHIHDTLYSVNQIVPLTPVTMLLAAAAGIVFGLTAQLFAHTTHAISALFKRRIAYPPLRPFVGGILIAMAVLISGVERTGKYIGLGLPTIAAAFTRQLPPYDFAGKLLFTSVTLGSSFKGGEVTPLFYIGATLGNALSHIIPLPTSLLAAMGFVAVFAGAANTPLASSLMALELFGPEAGAFCALASVTSYLFSGESGIYHAQRVGIAKFTPTVRPSRTAPRPARPPEPLASEPVSSPHPPDGPADFGPPQTS